MAASVSSRPASSTSPTLVPSAGQRISRRAPARALTHWPSTYSSGTIHSTFLEVLSGVPRNAGRLSQLVVVEDGACGPRVSRTSAIRTPGDLGAGRTRTAGTGPCAELVPAVRSGGWDVLAEPAHALADARATLL